MLSLHDIPQEKPQKIFGAFDLVADFSNLRWNLSNLNDVMSEFTVDFNSFAEGVSGQLSGYGHRLLNAEVFGETQRTYTINFGYTI